MAGYSWVRLAKVMLQSIVPVLADVVRLDRYFTHAQGTP